jgi:hypothetical protein
MVGHIRGNVDTEVTRDWDKYSQQLRICTVRHDLKMSERSEVRENIKEKRNMYIA